MPIEVDDLIARAREQTGLNDFGNPSYQEPLRRLIYALNTEAELNASGVAMASNIIVRSLKNRLRIEDWWKRQPQLENETIARPIIIIGMSRSGTTALSHLLARDRSLRSLLAWEARESVPPPRAETYWSDPRYLAAVEADEDAPFSKIKALHYDPPDAPVECNLLFNLEFLSTGFSTLFHIPTYVRWMLNKDTTYMYDYHARVLKLLQSEAPGRWNLKAPQHAFDPEQLRAHYPDAIFVLTHRSPVECVASTSSLLSTINQLTSDVRRPREIGALVTEFFDRMAERLVAFAHDHAGDGLVHIPYAQLTSDPMAAVRRVFEAADHDLSQEAEAAIWSQIESRPQHSAGVHRYDLEDFGLERGELEERFAEYIKAFGDQR